MNVAIQGEAGSPIASAGIHSQLVVNDIVFPVLPVAITALQAAITDYDAKLAAKASRATDDFIAFEVSRHALENDLAMGGGVHQGSSTRRVTEGQRLSVK